MKILRQNQSGAGVPHSKDAGNHNSRAMTSLQTGAFGFGIFNPLTLDNIVRPVIFQFELNVVFRVW